MRARAIKSTMRYHFLSWISIMIKNNITVIVGEDVGKWIASNSAASTINCCRLSGEQQYISVTYSIYLLYIVLGT